MTFSFSLNSCTEDELAKAAHQQFGETDNLMTSSLKDLRMWISQSPHLHSIQQDDKVLKTFLRGCKFSLERTKEKLDNFHAIKGSCPEWFGDWDPESDIAQEILGWGSFLYLPGFDREGRLVLVSRVKNIDRTKVDFNSLMWTWQMIMATAAQKCDEQQAIKGMVMITDMEGASPGHLTLFNITIMKKLITMMTTAFPMKPKARHILNMPSIFEGFFQRLQKLQKEKMQMRTSVHKPDDLTALHEDLGTEILPAEYGGTNGTLASITDYWKTEVTANRAFLMSLSQYKTDESKRPGKPRDHAELFGIEGSFRKLEID